MPPPDAGRRDPPAATRPRDSSVTLEAARDFSVTLGASAPHPYGWMRIRPGLYSPLWVDSPRSICAGWASTIVSKRRSEPQS